MGSAGLTGSRLYREIRGLGYAGGYTALKDFLRQVRPRPAAGFEIRFETPAGRQAQVDFGWWKRDGLTVQPAFWQPGFKNGASTP
jgi:transposase